MKDIDRENKNKRRLLGRIIACVIGSILLACNYFPRVAFAKENLAYGTSSVAESEDSAIFHAFYPANATFTQKMQSYLDELDSVSFAFAQIEAGNPDFLNTTKGKNENYGFYYPKDYLLPMEYAKSQGKSIQLNIYMSGKDGSLILPYKDQRAAMLASIMEHLETEIAQDSNLYYDGVVIDFEGLRDTEVNGEAILYGGKSISVYFVQFLKELKVKLERLDLKLYVAVNPLLYYDGYDYAKILKLADQVILMAHDYEPTKKLYKYEIEQYIGYDALEPIHSLAPIHQVRQSLNDLLKAAGDASMLSKVWLQISFDAAQWQFNASSMSDWNKISNQTISNTNRITPLYETIKARVENKDGAGKNISYGYNNELQSPYLQYINTLNQTYNIILYEDSNSIDAKINLAKSYQLGGISLWGLSNVPDYNNEIGEKYGLDGWKTILNAMEEFTSLPAKANTYVTFSDKAIESAIRQKLGKPSGKITEFELGSIYRLKLGQGVKSLADLKKLKYLEYLDASSLGIKDISKLSSLTNLRVLYLQRNKITDITPLKKLTKLEVLSLNGNRITSVKSLAKLKTLQKLYLKDNQLKSIYDLQWLGSLKELYVKGNSITSYSSMKKIYAKQGFVCDFVIK